MKPVRSLLLALTVGGLGATAVFAQSGAPGYPLTSRYAAPGLLPSAETSGRLIQSTQTARSVHHVAPAANYVSATTGPIVSPATTYYPPSRATSRTSRSSLYYPQLTQNANGGQESEPVERAPMPPPPPTANDMAPQPEIITPPHGMPLGSYEQAAADGCWSGDCGVNVPSCCGPSWYGYVGGLVMGRDRSNKFWTSFQTGNNANQLMYFPGANWGGGFETTVGYAWCYGGDGCGACGPTGRHGIEATYWGLWGLDSEASLISDVDQLSTPIDLGFVDVAGDPTADYFDNAREHRVRRENEFHNVEINLVDFGTPVACRGTSFNWLLGARFFKFDEFLQFASVQGGEAFGSDGGINEIYLDQDIENNLIGAQIGGRGDWRMHERFGVFAATKLGLFANDINYDVRVYRGDGTTAIFNQTGNTFDLEAGKTDVSFLAQLDLGVNWAFSHHWSANLGYRAVAITGLALADDQIPAFLAAEADWTDIDSNGSMILHGAFAGLEFKY